MAGNKYLVDTVIVAGYFNRDTAIRQHLQGNVIYVSATTIGELYFGAYNSQQRVNNIQQIKSFITLNTVLQCDETTGDFYGQVKQKLRAKGRPIPENDIWIAATALQHGLTLATRDAHFQEVDGLLYEIW